ncbi:PIN domain-containing protein [Treponema primitia]|uniref:PIN domain-containing protein n=1 Tax=Treponema primitia TaxID=88058 RepID=UPI00397EE2F4
MKYLLDTNICIYFLNGNKKILEKINQVSDQDMAIAIITLAELQFGAYNSNQIQNNLKRIEYLRSKIKVINLTPEITEKYAAIKSSLRKSGTIIDDFDILIGSSALVNDLRLVTNNQQHFQRISKLVTENWVE